MDLPKVEAIFMLGKWDGILAIRWKNKIYNTDGTAFCMNRTGEAQSKILIAA